MCDANEMPVGRRRHLRSNLSNILKQSADWLSKDRAPAGIRQCRLWNLGRHGLFQADLARPEYIMAGALRVRTTGSPCVTTGLTDTGERGQIILRGCSMTKRQSRHRCTSMPRIVRSPRCWPDELGHLCPSVRTSYKIDSHHNPLK